MYNVNDNKKMEENLIILIIQIVDRWNNFFQVLF